MAEVTESAPLNAKLTKYKCVTKCFWNGKVFHEEDTIDVPAGVKVPEHFELVKKD